MERMPAEYAREIQGIADSTKLQVGWIWIINMMYEITGFCTSAVVQDGDGVPWHGRNLDFGEFFGVDKENHTWSLTEALRKLLVTVTFTRGGKEVQFAAGEPKSELPDPTGWCTEELFAERVAGLARHADYLLCIDVLTGAPGGVELFRVQSDPIGAHTLFREPEEHGWALEPGRDMVVLLRHEGSPPSRRRRASSSGGCGRSDR